MRDGKVLFEDVSVEKKREFHHGQKLIGRTYGEKIAHQYEGMQGAGLDAKSMGRERITRTRKIERKQKRMSLLFPPAVYPQD